MSKEFGLETSPTNFNETIGPSVSEKAVQELKKQLRGELLRPGNEDYNAARAVWNGTWVGSKQTCVSMRRIDLGLNPLFEIQSRAVEISRGFGKFSARVLACFVDTAKIAAVARMEVSSKGKKATAQKKKT